MLDFAHEFFIILNLQYENKTIKLLNVKRVVNRKQNESLSLFINPFIISGWYVSELPLSSLRPFLCPSSGKSPLAIGFSCELWVARCILAQVIFVHATQDGGVDHLLRGTGELMLDNLN